MKVAVYTIGGICAVMVPQEDCLTDGKTFISLRHSENVKGFRQATVEEIAAKDIPSGIDYQIIEESELPDRHFRDAWKIESGAVIIDMPKAREIHMGRIRAARAEKFVELGFPHRLNPAVEDAVVDASTKDTLKKLRDIPQTLDLSTAATPDELKTIWPVELSEG